MRIGDKWAVVKQTGDAWGPQGILDGSAFYDVVFNGRQSLQVGTLQTEVRRRPVSNGCGRPRAENTEMVLAGSVDRSPIFDRGSLYSYCYAGKLIFGHLGNSGPILCRKRYRMGNRQRDNDNRTLPDCVVIVKRRPFGQYTAWLDAANGFLPRRIELIRRGSDRQDDGTPVNEYPRYKPTSFRPSTQLVEVRRVR